MCNKTMEELQTAYVHLCHAMQSGVASKMHYSHAEVEPKHLRVGVNSAMVEHSALVNLLIKKGFIDEREYHEALNEAMRNEVTSYEKDLSDIIGKPVTLG